MGHPGLNTILHVENLPRLGPEPVRPAPAGSLRLTGAQERVARALAGHADVVTVAALSAEVGGHPNTTRVHLDTLVSRGLASRQPLPAHGRGRPSMGYAVTATGRGALGHDGDPLAQEYLGLATAFAIHLAERGSHPREEARAVGRVWGDRLASGVAGAARDARERVVDLLARLGFSPGADTDDAGLALRSCPLLDAAREYPEVICSVHEGLVVGALAAYGEPRSVRLRAFAEPGACRLLMGDPVRAEAD